MGTMELERVTPHVRIVGETDWRIDLFRWATWVAAGGIIAVVVAVTSVLMVAGAWGIRHLLGG
jgi:hypothetical protein